MKARKDMQIVFQDPYASLNPRMTTRDIRCNKRMDKCAQSVPKLGDAGGGHQVACFLYHDPA